MRYSALAPAIALAVTAAASAAAQQSATLAGTWRLASMTQPDSSGGVRHYWSEHPLGLIIYTADGHMAAQLYDPRRPRLGVSWNTAAPEAAREAFAGMLSYYGTYTVDPAAATVTHAVEGAMSPDWIGSKLVRAYRFLGPDQVELRVVTDAAGRRVTNGTVLVWERVR